MTDKLVAAREKIPHERDQWMEFKPLTWRRLEAAEAIRSKEAMDVIASVPGDTFARIQESGSDNGRRERRRQEPADQYDKGTVLEGGIVAWSYDAEVNEQNIGLLDAITADWAFRHIISQNVRSQSEGEVSGGDKLPPTVANQDGRSS